MMKVLCLTELAVFLPSLNYFLHVLALDGVEQPEAFHQVGIVLGAA